MIGSLFSGIGGIEMGLELCGLGPVLWQCDNDAHARRVLALHWPLVRRYNDVREIDETAERPNIICGGFPCQDISVAGKGAGLGGKRSGLWFEYARIVRALRPGVVFVENVAALIGRGLDRVLGDLAALGFDAEWDVFRASDVGAPHRRARLFLLAYTDRERVRQLAERDQRQGGRVRAPERGNPESLHAGEALADATGAGRGRASESLDGGRRSAPVQPGQAQPDGRRGDVANTDGARLEGRDEREPQRAIASGSRSVADSDGRGREGLGLAQSAGAEGARGRVAGGRDHQWHQHRFPPGPAGIAEWDGPQPAIRRGDDGIPVGLDRRWRAKIGGPDRLRLLGNAVVPQQAALAWRTLTARALSAERAA